MATRSGDQASGDKPEVAIDRDACMGSGNCVFWAPEVFDLDDEGVAAVRGPITGHEDEVRMAAKNCPTSAIRINGVLPT
jgi:ferredoxin